MWFGCTYLLFHLFCIKNLSDVKDETVPRHAGARLRGLPIDR